MISKLVCRNKISSIKFFSSVVNLCYEDIINPKKDLSESIDKAYGMNGLGLLKISDIPDFKKLRTEMLQISFQLCQLPEHELEKLKSPESRNYVGWSRGVQYLDDGNDYLQAMFYARIFTEKLVYPKDPKLEDIYTNIWPNIANFKENYKKLGLAIANCQISLLNHLDKYIEQVNPKYETGFLYKNFKKDNDTVGMLATYYPQNSINHKEFEGKGKKDNWCGWHRDFGLLTGLCKPMYFNSKTKKNVENLKTGLLIKSRNGKISELNYEEDELAIQAGDALFIYSGGNVISTPHAVKITDGIPEDVFRLNFINFFEPAWKTPLKSADNNSSEEVIKKDPFQMSNVITKFREGITYKDFIMETFEKMVKI